MFYCAFIIVFGEEKGQVHLAAWRNMSMARKLLAFCCASVVSWRTGTVRCSTWAWRSSISASCPGQLATFLPSLLT